MFSELRRRPLYQQVAQHIQDLILSGELKPGDQLPAEAELCEQIGVSRTVIREATRSLMERGLLSAEPGRGTFVTAVSCKDVAVSFGIFVKAADVSTEALAEVRELLEVRIAELAAERASPEYVAKLEQAIEEMEEHIESVEEFISADHKFHTILAEATQNSVFLCMIGFLVEELQDIRRKSTYGPCHVRRAARAQDFHRLILKCVKERDQKGAAAAMHQHLQDVMRAYESALLEGDEGKDKATLPTAKAP